MSSQSINRATNPPIALRNEQNDSRPNDSHSQSPTRTTLIPEQNVHRLNSWPTSFSSLSYRRRISPVRRVNSARVHPTQPAVPGSDRWEWHVQTLPPLPPYICLERTAKSFRGIPPEDFSKRISRFLRINSISAVYHHDFVECTTFGFVKFVIQLWGDDTDSEVVVVEVQRRNGCCLRMKNLRASIYHAITAPLAEHDVPSPTIQDSHQVPTDLHVAFFSQESRREGCMWTLQTAQRLLRSDCVDQNKLGMECLLSVVQRSISSDQQVSGCVAKSIVCGTGKHSDHLRTDFSEYFHDTCIGNESDSETDPENEDSGYARGHHFGVLHLIALQVLENSLQRVLELRENGHAEIELDVKSWFWRNLLEALVYNVEVAHCRPLEAAISSKCLSHVMTLAPEVRHCRRVEERLIPGLIQAHTYGRAHHLKLETESENLMGRLS